jgi:hypothetical protein
VFHHALLRNQSADEEYPTLSAYMVAMGQQVRAIVHESVDALRGLTEARYIDWYAELSRFKK